MISTNTELEKEPKVKFKISTFVFVLAFHLITAIFAYRTFTINNFILFFVLYVVTGLGITLGYHRLFTHNSFVVNSKFLKIIIAIMGTLALQGSVIDWVVDHFQHHLHSDQVDDPHNSRQGFWWSHVWWLFYPIADTNQQSKLRIKLNEDPILRFFDQKIVFVGMQVILGAFLLFGFSYGALIWGVFVRVVFVWHVTWCINSACHIWGNTQYLDSGDHSKNLWWMAILANGEGWHNNHHKFQTSPKHGLKWYQVDVTWYIISTLHKIKLVSLNEKLIPKV
jgi:sn-1 stearoyl-lipid 9-desaturase